MHIGCDYGILNGFISMGATFMTAFFLLSGFSLFYTCRAQDFSDIECITSFYRKRILSIIPLYWFICIVYPVYDVLVNHGSALTNLLLFPLELLGLQQAFHSLFPFTHNGGTWFISCLIFCYALFPFLSRLFRCINTAGKKMLCLVLTVICIYSPFVATYLNISDIYSNIFFRLLEFSIGILLSSLITAPGKTPLAINTRTAAFFFCGGFFALIFLVSLGVHFSLFVNNYMIYNLVCLPLFCLLLIAAFYIPHAPDGISRLFSYFSKISYAFFLAQFFVWKLTSSVCSQIGTDNNLIKITISFVSCLLLSVFMHEWIEKNVRRLMQKYWKHN